MSPAFIKENYRKQSLVGGKVMKINTIAVLAQTNGPEFLERHAERIKEVLPEVNIVVAYEEDELMKKTTDADVLLTWPFKKIDKFCSGAPSLKWVHAFTAGVDRIMNSKVGSMNVRISNTKGIHGYPISDHVLSNIYLFLRAYPTFFRQQLNKEWNKEPRKLMDEASAMTVGIIGLGNIGLEIARKCKLLDMRVLATKNTPFENEWVDRCYPPTQLNELLEQSDFIVITVPLTEATANMIGEQELQLMKSTSVLINVARGGVVNEVALVKALRENLIRGAALDVFSEEPLPTNNPLWDLPNVVITPHMAAQSAYYMDRAVNVIIENLQRFSRDEVLLFEIDKKRGY